MSIYDSIFIATFSPWKNGRRSSTNGMIEPLLYYFLPRFKRIWLLDQPYPGSDRYLSRIEKYNSGKHTITNRQFSLLPLLPWLYVTNRPGTHLSFKIRDFISILLAGISSSKPFDIFVGLESVNALAGVLLRKMGKVKKVCYYCSDYSPKRFQSPLLNSIYLWLDRMAATHSDYIWDVSLAIQPARLSAGLDKKKSAKVIYVPNALFKEQLIHNPFEKREKNSLVFMGTLGLENGPDIAIQALGKVIKKIPSAKLHIIGGGGKGFEQGYLEKLTKKLNLEKHVIFYGFISDVKKVSSIIKNFQIALAPYKYIPGSIRLYGDATKIRQYVAAGLPIITTHVPPLGKEVEKKYAATITNDNADSFAESIIQLLKDKKRLSAMAKNANAFSRNNTWENTYGNAVKIMQKSQ